MANFKTHIITATVASGVVSTALSVMGLLNNVESVVMLTAGIIGGALPDIDSDNSTPLKIAFTLVSILIAFVVMFNQPFGNTVIELLIIWCVAFLFMRFVILRLFQSMTVHRGVIHSIPAACISGLLAVHFVYWIIEQNSYFAWLFGSFITFGFLIHLLLDEVYSVNLFGIQVKRSLGSALKLYDPNQLGLSLLFYIIVVLLYLAAPDNSEFFTLIFDNNNLTRFFAMLYPRDGWFVP